nr:hypothetical protein [Bacteroides intestinalis]
MTTEAVQYSKEQSTDIVYKKKKRLAKSGKDKVTTEAVQYSKEQSTDIVYKKKKRLAKSGKDSER